MTWLNAPLKRNTRRLLSIVALIMLSVTFFAGFLGERFVFLTLLLPVPCIFLFMWLNRATAKVATAKFDKLDERQRGLRDRAYRLTFSVITLYALFMLLVEFFGFGDRYVSFGISESPTISLLLTLNVFLLSGLPILFVAWLEPDPIQEETAYSVQKGSAT